MKTVTISELRANLLKYLARVQGGERIEVTSKGAVMATLVPPVGEREAARARLAELASTAKIGDVVTPIDEDWEAGR
jgi:prevent-host-death family protein